MDEKPGRNDPCHCGSGLKYKKCHMPADREAERERRDALIATRYLRNDLLTFARDERFVTSFAAALPLYWNNYYTIETAEEMSENEAIRFADWFAFDYRDDNMPRRLLAIYCEERWDDLSTQQRAVLDQWQQAGPAGAYTLVGYDGQTLHLQDIFTDEAIDVYHPGGRGDVEVGDVILARILPVLDHLEFGGAAAYIPADEIEDLREKLEAARAADLEAHPDASVNEFLRRNNHLLVHHALEQAEKNGRPPVARLEEE